MGRDDDVLRGDPAAGGPHHVAGVHRPRPLVDLGQLPGQRDQVLVGMELGLVVEAHGARHGIGQRRRVHERRRQAGRRCGLRLGLDLGPL
jgi:hypothetical protein